MPETFIRSSKAQPCPVCTRDHDGDCRWDSEKFLCHSNIERTEVTGFGYRGKTKDGLWGIYVKEDVWAKPPRPKGRKEYIYESRDGQPLVKVTRVDDGRSRQFFQSHWNGERWVKGLSDSLKSQIPIYRYSEVRTAITQGQTIFMVEGEGCADALWKIGIAATTTLGGSKKYNSYGTYANDLKGDQLVLCPDRDVVGVAHMKEVAKDFPGAQWCYPLPHSKVWQALPSGGGYDVTDWIDEGATAEMIFQGITQTPVYCSENNKTNCDNDLQALVEKIQAIEDLERPTEMLYRYWQLSKQTGYSEKQLKSMATAIEASEPVRFVSVKDFVADMPPQKEWLLRGFLAQGVTAMIVAEAKTGKSILHYDMAYAVATGDMWGEFATEGPKPVLIIQTDEPKREAGERMIIRGLSELNNVYVNTRFHFEQVNHLKKRIEELRPGLLIIDSLTSVSLTSNVSEKDAEFARPLYKLAHIASDYGCTVLTIHHVNKMPSDSGMSVVAGSTRIPAAVSEIYQLTYTKDSHSTDRVLTYLGGRSGKKKSWLITKDDEDNSIIWKGDYLGEKASAVEQAEAQAEVALKGNARETIFGFLNQRSPSPFVITEICEYTNVSHIRAKQICSELFKEGVVARKKTGKAFAYWIPKEKIQKLSDSLSDSSPNPEPEAGSGLSDEQIAYPRPALGLSQDCGTNLNNCPASDKPGISTKRPLLDSLSNDEIHSSALVQQETGPQPDRLSDNSANIFSDDDFEDC